MNIRIHQGHEAGDVSRSIVVVIDVLRAFTLTSYLYQSMQVSRPLQRIKLVADVDEALDYKVQYPETLLIGEVDGFPIPGFDFGNSPYYLSQAFPINQPCLLRTTNGVVSVMNVRHSSAVFAAALVNAKTTVNHIVQKYCQDPIMRQAFDDIVLLATDRHGSDEDLACSEYMKGLFLDVLNQGRNSHAGNKPLSLELAQQRVLNSENAKKFRSGHTAFPQQDVQWALKENPASLALKVLYQKQHVYLERDDG